MTLPGPLIYWIYWKLALIEPSIALKVSESKASLSEILASFSFTLLGFLAAFVTILFSLGGSRAFSSYKDGGYLILFLSIYVYAILTLGAAFASALISSASSTSAWWFRGAICLCINSFFQVAVLSFIVINLSIKAYSEK
jgi:hypothetical protein